MSSIRIKVNKNNNNQEQRTPDGGIDGGFNTDVMSTLSDMFFDEETEVYGYVNDKFLKVGFSAFAKSLNLEEYPSSETAEYVYINLKLGYFKYKENLPEGFMYKYQLPYDWESLIGYVSNYLEKNPITKKEVVEKNTDDWNLPREQQGVLNDMPPSALMVVDEGEDVDDVEYEQDEYYLDNNPDKYLVDVTAIPQAGVGFYLALCPKRYFEQANCLYDQSCENDAITNILNHLGYAEEAEGTWFKQHNNVPTQEEANGEMNRLVSLGFSVDINFSNFINTVTNSPINQQLFDVFK